MATLATRTDGGFPLVIPPVNNIAAFTYKEGATYLEILYGLRDYVNGTMRPEFNTELSRLLLDFNEGLATWEELFTAFQTDMSGQVQNLNDGAVKAMVENAAGPTGVALRALIDALAVTPAEIPTQVRPLIEAAITEVNALIESNKTAADLELGKKIPAADKGVAGGVATLDSTGKIPAAQVPAASLSGTYANRPGAGTVPNGITYYATDVMEQYRSNGTGWQAVGVGGSELGYAELNTDFVTASTTKVDVPGLTVTFTAGERPIDTRFSGLLQAADAAARPTIHILLDGTVVGEIPNRIDPTAQGYMVFERTRRLPPMTPGSVHTIKIQVSSTGGNVTVFGVPVNPAGLSVVTR